MMTLQEVLVAIEEARKARNFLYESNETNYKLIRERICGTFEAVEGRNKDLFLMPQMEAPFFLYRGQNQEYTPCFPSLYRGNPSEAQIFVNRMRLVLFKRLLDSHPVVKHFFQRNHFMVDVEGLAQHYGLKTSILDLTNDIDVAMFFATCKYDTDTDTYQCYDDNDIHEAVLYIFDPLMDNEPCPPMDLEIFNGDIRCIGLQPFLRPAAQSGFALHIEKGCSIKCYMYKFSFTSKDSKYYFEKFRRGENLWIKDELISKTKQIAEVKDFSFDQFNETFKQYRPKSYSGNSLKKALRQEGIKLVTRVPKIEFSKEEIVHIIDEWNNCIGKEFVQKIVRKPWYEHDGIDSSNHFCNIRNQHNYRSLQRLNVQYIMALLKARGDAPNGAKWVNYMNTPLTARKRAEEKTESQEIPAFSEIFFGKTYLEERDWRIPSNLNFGN